MWTDERIERALALRAEGRSATEIARDLGGVTRNAVLGKLDRLKKHRPVVAAYPGRFNKKRIVAPAPNAEASHNPQQNEEVTFEHLKSDQCKWPIDRKFCGRKKPMDYAIPYCAEHMRRAHRHS